MVFTELAISPCDPLHCIMHCARLYRAYNGTKWNANMDIFKSNVQKKKFEGRTVNPQHQPRLGLGGDTAYALVSSP